MNSIHKRKTLCTLEKNHNRNILPDKFFPTNFSPKEKAKMVKTVFDPKRAKWSTNMCFTGYWGLGLRKEFLENPSKQQCKRLYHSEKEYSSSRLEYVASTSNFNVELITKKQ